MADSEQKVPAASDEATTINVNSGDQFTITLDANHSTGYSWGLSDPLDATLLELVSADYETNPHPPMMVGVPGHETWTIRALAPGSATINLVYRQPWSIQVDPAESKTFTVEIIQP